MFAFGEIYLSYLLFVFINFVLNLGLRCEFWALM
jgi:hypothetical protein